VPGARIEAAGDLARAWPEPGEAASVRWLVADPRPAPPLGWAFSVCVGAPTIRGLPECDAPPFVELHSPGLGVGAPSFVFTMPDAATLADTDRVLIRGAICADAEPLLVSHSRQLRWRPRARITRSRRGRAEAGNRNPTLDELVLFDGRSARAVTRRQQLPNADAAPGCRWFR
jgi:hypothetical protein